MNIIRIMGGSSEPKVKRPIVLKSSKTLTKAKKQIRRKARAEKKLARKSFTDKKLQKTFARAEKNKKGFSSLYVEHGKPKPHRLTTKHVRLGFAVLAGLLLLGAVGNLLFGSKTLPNTFIADINIGGMGKDQIIDKLKSGFETTKINITSGKTKTTTTLAKLGITVDYAATADQAISLQNQRGFFSIYNPARKSAEIIVSYDITRTEATLARSFANIEKSPTSAEVVWNSDKNIFEVIPSSRGKKLNSATIASRVVSFLSSVDVIDVYAEPLEIIPEVETPDADVLKDYLNSEILGLNVSVPPIANTKSANLIKSLAAQKLSNTKSDSYEDLAHAATSTLVRN